MKSPSSELRAAASQFSTRVRVGDPTAGLTGAHVRRVAGDLGTTITLLESGARRVALVATHFGSAGDDASLAIQRAVADALDLPVDHVLSFSSHNHSAPLLEKRTITGYELHPREPDPTPLGKRFIRQLRDVARSLPAKLEPVTVWYGQGREGRITYNRKGRRADRSTYLMREEDRQLIGEDFRGDIDEEAPIVCLKSRDDGRIVTILTHFTGHPVTTYHPEQFTAHGDWPQVACEILSRRLRVPVSFLQGCAGDINSKHMFSGDVALATRYGRWLAAAYLDAFQKMRQSKRPGMDYVVAKARVPFAGLPSPRVLRDELSEMTDFVVRARRGDQDTLTCVGLNFARAMTPAYRGKLIEYVMPWNRWALRMHERNGHARPQIPKFLELDVHVLRLGDVGIVGMPTEPFIGIGRQIRAGSPLPLTIPCGYTNQATGFVGYIPDSPNVGDREYQSAFYRYTRYCPPFRKPGGDVMAQVAIQTLNRFVRACPKPPTKSVPTRKSTRTSRSATSTPAGRGSS